MPLYSIFDIAGSAMSAQTVRLNTTASNLANAESVSGTEEGAYRARQPIFATVMDAATMQSQGVRVAGIVESPAPVVRKYEPANPLADEQGNVYMPNVNVIEEMANMISASRSFQNNVEVLNTSKELMTTALRLGQ